MLKEVKNIKCTIKNNKNRLFMFTMCIFIEKCVLMKTPGFDKKTGFGMEFLKTRKF